MEQSNTTTETAPPTTPQLVRPREGRMVAGVAQGLANRLDMPVVLIRVVFALLAFAGGLGLALYAAGWFLIRSEDEAETPAERFFSGGTTSRSWIGMGLVLVAVLVLLDNFTFLSGGVVWAVGLLVVGILLYTGDLPRLVNQRAQNEGAEPMTSSGGAESAVEATGRLAGGAMVGESTPIDPASTPPVFPPKIAPPRERSYLGRMTIGVMLVGLGVLATLDNVPGMPLEPQPRHYMALAVTILGLGLIAGGFIGRARWLILLGVVMVPTMLFSPVFEYDWSTDDFDRIVSPDSFGELDTSYSLDAGNLVIDLRDLPWDGNTIELDAQVNAGNIEIRLPDDVGLLGEASVDVGRVAGLGRESAGLGSRTLHFDHPGVRGTLELDATVNVGNIDIQVRD